MDALQFVNLVLMSVLLTWGFLWVKQNHGAELYAVPVMIFALHGILFYFSFWVEQMHGMDIFMHHTWSAGFRLHGLVTMFLLSISLQRLRKRVLI